MIKIISAISKNNRGIGFNNSIPWNSKIDLQFFKNITSKPNSNNILIMGHNTWKSLPFKPLPNRINVIISSKNKEFFNFNYHNVILFNDIYKALNYFHNSFNLLTYDNLPYKNIIDDLKPNNIFIIGGENIYKQTINFSDEIYLNIINKNFICDSFFPNIPSSFNLNSVSTSFDDSLNCNIDFLHYNKNFNSNILNPDIQYFNAINNILNNGFYNNDRTGTGIIKYPGINMRFSLSDNNLPLLTTKKMFFNGIIHELLWFLKGQTNNKILQKNNVHIWDDNTSSNFLKNNNLPYNEGDAGPIYGFNFRHYGADYIDCNTNYSGLGFDQVNYVINLLKNNPHSRRILINLWNPTILHKQSLPPCHLLYQFIVNDDKLSCILYQRSGDMGLGVPFNITSASIMTYIFAHLSNLKPFQLIHYIGDAHIYNDHIQPLQQQILREPFPSPKLFINPNKKFNSIEDFNFDDFIIKGYLSHDKINMKMSI